MTIIKSSLFVFLFLFIHFDCFALLTGSKASVSITSENLELNPEQGFALYLGNVLLTQEGKTLTADKLIIYKNPEGKLNKILAFGKPAKYLGTIKNEPLSGEANKITFFPNSQEMLLEGQAKFIQKQDSFTAPHITYNFQTKMIKSKSQNGIRPTIVFNPN